jgi:hypothetical protein
MRGAVRDLHDGSRVDSGHAPLGGPGYRGIVALPSELIRTVRDWPRPTADAPPSETDRIFVASRDVARPRSNDLDQLDAVLRFKHRLRRALGHAREDLLLALADKPRDLANVVRE